METKARTDVIAAACHSAWFAYTVLGLGEQGEPWGNAPEYQRDSLRDAVGFWDVECTVIPESATIQEKVKFLAPLSHENWMEARKDDGWVYGEVKDEEKKTHPCLVPYDQLPHDQMIKDEVVLQAYLALRPLV